MLTVTLYNQRGEIPPDGPNVGPFDTVRCEDDWIVGSRNGQDETIAGRSVGGMFWVPFGSDASIASMCRFALIAETPAQSPEKANT